MKNKICGIYVQAHRHTRGAKRTAVIVVVVVVVAKVEVEVTLCLFLFLVIAARQARQL